MCKSASRYGVESVQLFGHCTRSMKFESCKKNATITGPAETRGGGTWGVKSPPPPLCVQMDFTRTFQTNAKCKNIDYT